MRLGICKPTYHIDVAMDGILKHLKIYWPVGGEE